MNEAITIYNGINPAALPFIIGGVLAGCWFALYVLERLVNWSFAWVDDAEPKKRSRIIDFLMMNVRKCKISGYPDVFHYEKDGEYGNGLGTFFFVGIGIFLIPPLLTFLLTPVLLIITFVAFAHLVRFGRRGQKALSKHIEDKDAHK